MLDTSPNFTVRDPTETFVHDLMHVLGCKRIKKMVILSQPLNHGFLCLQDLPMKSEKRMGELPKVVSPDLNKSDERPLRDRGLYVPIGQFVKSPCISLPNISLAASSTFSFCCFEKIGCFSCFCSINKNQHGNKRETKWNSSHE